MKLTRFTNYALRVMQLAALREPALVRIDDVARIHDLARPHVVKIVHELGRAGYLQTLRGRGGGFRLGRPADQIVVGEIVRLTEGPLEIVECFRPQSSTCPLIGICVLSKALHEAADAFMAVLDNLTVADISANRDELLDRIAPLEETGLRRRLRV